MREEERDCIFLWLQVFPLTVSVSVSYGSLMVTKFEDYSVEAFLSDSQALCLCLCLCLYPSYLLVFGFRYSPFRFPGLGPTQGPFFPAPL